MKRSQNIEYVRLVAENQSLQSKLAFYMQKAENSVSREEYDSKEAECSVLRAKLATISEILRQNCERHEAEQAELNARLKEYQEAQELLQAENMDFKTLWEFWQRHHFGASSETMTDMMDKLVGKLPDSKTQMLAEVLNIVDRLNHAGGETKLPAPAVCKEDGGESSGKSGRRVPGSNRKKTKCLDVREVFGADFSELPAGYKVMMRKGRPECFTVELIFMDRPHSYSKIFEVTRCNIPGDDPRNTKYPPMLFSKIPVDASFASFCLDMKFGYNMPESRILEILGKAGCRIPQATLNRWMHAVMDGLMNVLMPEIKKEIKASRFTHNDETRILVRSRQEDENRPSYKTEYIHGILSPEKHLFLMLYEDGSRSHTVQLDIFRESGIMAFLADRCPLYTALITALDCHPLIRGACWVHFRRYLLHAYSRDTKRMELPVRLIAMLFHSERLISKMKNLTETRRVRERERMCRPLVDCIFNFMQKIKDSGTEYGVLARRAADYLLNDREGFTAFLKCGLLEIGNNAVERCFRNIAKGRENWLQCGSHQAAQHTAFMYSLVESCKLNDIDFGKFIETVLRRIQNGDTDYATMLPNRITLVKEAGNTAVA